MKKAANILPVIFGASGDLTARKLIPALFSLHLQNLLDEKITILGTGRTEYDNAAWRETMANSLREFHPEGDKTEVLQPFLKRLHYIPLETKQPEQYTRLKEKIADLAPHGNCLFYMAVPPSMYQPIVNGLSSTGLTGLSSNKGNKSIIVEKPFGIDLQSARELNRLLHRHWDENDLYRIDHYLGKETVQNILVTRFSNSIFEPLWNRNYISHIQITASEDIGVGKRGGYYDQSGALRDMIQNHLLQLTALAAMEPPATFDSNALRNETLKIFQSLRPLSREDVRNNVIRAQYTAAKTAKGEMAGYRDESGVPADSRTETFAAVKFYIDNFRWGGVPFLLRTGKRLPARVSEIVVQFKTTPHHLFKNMGDKAVGDLLVIRIQPDEGILLKLRMKVPGAGYRVHTVNLDFHYSELDEQHLPSAYERLLLDAMHKDNTLYLRGDAVEACWKFVAPIQEAWQEDPAIPLYGYPAGSWGPPEAEQLITPAEWRYPCRNLNLDGKICLL